MVLCATGWHGFLLNLPRRFCSGVIFAYTCFLSIHSLWICACCHGYSSMVWSGEHFVLLTPDRVLNRFWCDMTRKENSEHVSCCHAIAAEALRVFVAVSTENLYRRRFFFFYSRYTTALIGTVGGTASNHGSQQWTVQHDTNLQGCLYSVSHAFWCWHVFSSAPSRRRGGGRGGEEVPEQQSPQLMKRPLHNTSSRGNECLVMPSSHSRHSTGLSSQGEVAFPNRTISSHACMLCGIV